MLALVLVHGVFWSGLLSASAAYMTNMLPERRRAEGIGYWGLSTVAAMAVAPTIGFWIYQLRLGLAVRRSRGVLNLVMAVIAWQPATSSPRRGAERGDASAAACSSGACWSLSLTLFLYSFGYGGITSFTALYADANGVDAEGHLSDDAGDRDAVHAAAGRPAGRSVRLQACVRAVPGADQRRPGVPGVRRHARSG